jgi:two-component SAPR family response regulator
MKGRPSFAFNAETEDLYIIGEDSVHTIAAKDTPSVTASTNYSRMYAVNPSIYNSRTGKIYNVFTDQKTVREYDFSSKSWNGNFDNTTSEYWQVNKFFSSDNNLFILCGYGQLRYKNMIQRYNVFTKQWDILQPKGDFLTPRYLAALGTTASGDTAYLLGGFGSNKGDQLLSPKHFYDLLRYDVKTNTLKKIYTLPEPEEQFVFANSIVLDADNEHYYALVFPNSRFNTSLQLIKGSLSKPEYSFLGQPFPYSFNDVRSFTDLYYCKRSNRLLATTLFFQGDQSEVKVYSIDFPPNAITTRDTPDGVTTDRSPFRILYFIIPAAMLMIVFFFVRRRLRARKQIANDSNLSESFRELTPDPSVDLSKIIIETSPAAALIQPEQQVSHANNEHTEKTVSKEVSLQSAMGYIEEENGEIAKSKLLLFGSFEAITADGVKITKQFTPLLKEMFLLILIDSLRYNKGVSAEKLNEVLWSDKDIKDANNNRAVNIVKLKNILDKLGGCTISRESGNWKFEYDASLIYIDLADYLNIFFKQSSDEGRLQLSKLIRIGKAGSLLQEMHYKWLDGIKAEISNDLVESLLKYADQLDIHTNTEEIITICNVIFNFDELDEHALKLKCKSLIGAGRHTLANTTLTKFAAKYKEDFRESNNSVLRHHL